MIKVVVKVPHRDLQEVLCDLTSDLVWWFCSMCNQLLQCYKNKDKDTEHAVQLLHCISYQILQQILKISLHNFIPVLLVHVFTFFSQLLRTRMHFCSRCSTISHVFDPRPLLFKWCAVTLASKIIE